MLVCTDYLIETLQKSLWVDNSVIPILQTRKHRWISFLVQGKWQNLIEPRKPGVCFHSQECNSWLKIYWWVYPKEDLLKIKLTPNLRICTGYLWVMATLLCRLEEEWNTNVSKWNQTTKKLIPLLVKQSKVSQEGPSNVFSLTRLEWLRSCLSAAFAILNG